MATVDVQIAASADDSNGVEECTNWNNTAPHLGCGEFGGNHYQWACRYPGVTIPVGDTIDVAYESYYGDGTDAGSPTTKIYGEDADDPSATANCADLNGRTNTTAGVDWDSIIGNSGFVDTPSEVTIIQELNDTYDFSSGKALQMLHRDDSSPNGAYQSPEQFDNDSSHAPKIHIESSSAVTNRPQVIMF